LVVACLLVLGCALLPLRAESLGPVPAARPPGPVAAAGLPVSRSWNIRQTPVVDVVRRVRGAVVNIHSERNAQGTRVDDLFNLSPSQNRVNGMGTGVVIDPRGFILTNHHVVDEVQTLRVRLSDGTTYPARILCRDSEFDLALLKIEPDRPLPTMLLGTSSDLMPGETVIAIGNAYGYEHSVTVGVVSAVARDVTLNKEISYKGLIQTDASINPGNSGGPLLNVYGELIGVNVAIRAGAQGIGFALPVDSVARVAAALLAHAGSNPGTERRVAYAARPAGARLATGLVVRDEVQPHADAVVPASGELPPARRAVVESVEPDSPAARAGIRVGDQIVQVDAVACSCALDVERALLDQHGRLRTGERVGVRVRRGGTELRVELAVEAREPAETARAEEPAASAPLTEAGRPAEVVWRRLGLRVQGVGADSVSTGHPQLRGGLLIVEVREGSTADRAGLKSNDVLVGLHQWEMLTLDNVVYVLNHPDLATFQPLRFYILRAGQVHRGWLPVE
jgi:serine protease Do